MNWATQARRLGSDAAEIPVREEEVSLATGRSTVQRDVLEQPADSVADISYYQGGLSIEFPPLGVWRGSKGLFGFSLVWNGFMTIFTIFMATAMLSDGVEGRPPLVIIGLFLALFWAVGLGVLSAAVNAGRRKGGVAVASDRLMVFQQSMFQDFKREWSVDDLEHVIVAPTGTEINDVPVLALTVKTVSGDRHQFFSERNDDELHWAASHIRRALKMSLPGSDQEEQAETG